MCREGPPLLRFPSICSGASPARKCRKTLSPPPRGRSSPLRLGCQVLLLVPSGSGSDCARRSMPALSPPWWRRKRFRHLAEPGRSRLKRGQVPEIAREGAIGSAEPTESSNRRSASKRTGPPGPVYGERLFAQRVEAARMGIRLDLGVPLCRVIFREPAREARQFITRQRFDLAFDLFEPGQRRTLTLPRSDSKGLRRAGSRTRLPAQEREGG